MIAAAKRTVRHLAAAGPLAPVWRSLSGRVARIVVYHKFRSAPERADDAVDLAMLRRQLRHICRHYRVVPLVEIGWWLELGRAPAPRSIAITVDDAHMSFARLAWPVFREFGIPVTLFAISSLTETNGWLWAEQFAYLCRRAESAQLAGARRRQILAELKKLPPAARDARLAAVADQAGIRLPASPPDEHALMSWNDLRELANSGLVDIGSHSRTHPILSPLTGEQAAEEIIQSRQELQTRLGAAVSCFCYPNGMPGDFGPREIDLICRAGYTCSVASHLGYASEASDRFALPRIGGGIKDWSLFCKYLDGLQYLQQRCLTEAGSHR